MSTTEQASSDVATAHDDQIAVLNPATGATIAWVDDSGPEVVQRAAVRGRAVQPAWEALGFEGRGRVLRRAQKWITDHSDEFIETIVSETGKAWEDAQLAEVLYGSAAFGFWAENAEKYLGDEKVKTATPLLKGKKLILRHAPVGLVGVIGPWNYPFTNGFGDCIPALAAGNSVILKPSEETPLTSLLMERVLRECGLPDGVLQVVTGRGASTGSALVDVVDMIMFTGSTKTGKAVAKQAAERLIPASLELGGKDAMLVCADADLERAANEAVQYSMFNGGQTCISVERVYVEAPVYDDFLARVSKKTAALRQGVSTGAGSIDVGSLTFPPQLETVRSHVDDAVAKGATVSAGGEGASQAALAGGLFYPPTVLSGVDHSMLAMTEETFGPTLPVMKVADVEEGIRLANDSPYGLMASVFTKDTTKGERIARRLEAGMVHVNDVLIGYTALELPMGGWKTSGLGARHGAGGIRKFCRQQSIVVSRFHLRKEPQFYPYKGRGFRLVNRIVRFFYGRGNRD